MEDEKKVSAAVAGVMAYIEDEEAAVAAQAALRAMGPGALQAPCQTPSPWGLNGRQTMMQMRNMMQLRTFIR